MTGFYQGYARVVGSWMEKTAEKKRTGYGGVAGGAAAGAVAGAVTTPVGHFGHVKHVLAMAKDLGEIRRGVAGRKLLAKSTSPAQRRALIKDIKILHHVRRRLLDKVAPWVTPSGSVQTKGFLPLILKSPKFWGITAGGAAIGAGLGLAHRWDKNRRRAGDRE